MRPDGSDAAALMAARTDAALLDVAPDGRRLLWFGRDPATHRRGLYRSDLHGRRIHAVAGRRAGLSAVWSPDGRRIAFTVSGAGTFTVPVDGGHRRRIARTQLRGLAWQPRGQTSSVAAKRPQSGRSGHWRA
jgi:dipeptidyl aminopeptidase/acylaminoacyl peptidase